MENQITLFQLNTLVKESIKNSFNDQIWVIAEIGELNVNRTGHCYIDLVEKDPLSDQIVARARATIWSWQFRFIQPYFTTTTGQDLAAGMKVLVSVNVEYHEVYGLSLNIVDIDPAYTMGDMARKRKEIIDKLTNEGIIDMNKELALPDIPSRIAIISSGTAAGYQDFMNQLQNNNRGYTFYCRLFESTMQGNNSAQSIIQALEQIYNYEDLFDVVVIIRGGGSQMDLSCFDNYELAFHVTQFPIPVLTGIGHEKDESVTDMVANTKLKTPTAVAEFLIEKMDFASDKIQELEHQLFEKTSTIFYMQNTRLMQLSKYMKPLINAEIDHEYYALTQISRNLKPLINHAVLLSNNSLKQYSSNLHVACKSLLTAQHNSLSRLVGETSFAGKIILSKQTQTVNQLKNSIEHMLNEQFIKEEKHIEWLEKNCELVNPKSILKRGFSITSKNGKFIKSSSELKTGDEIETILYNGKIQSTIK